MKSELMKREEAKAKAVLPADVVQFIEKAAGKHRPESHLIAVLHKVQEQLGYLGKEHMDAVSILMQIPAAKVTGVASFYHFFNFTPRGKNRISLCLGTACFVKGAGKVLDKLKELLGIDVGQTTKDSLFSIDVARCVGACALAPVMIVNDKVYAEVRPDQVAKILTEYGFQAAKVKQATIKGAGAKAGK
jgi:NADH:ubiquinone oxidoreductase subunit E